MVHSLPHDHPAGLERSCAGAPRDWIKAAPPQPGIDRIEAFFAGHGYDPHRHDTYAVGLTLHGVQSFGYRGTTLHSRCGQAIVLHPDELHDGRAGTDRGFRYRMAYIEPRLLQTALGEGRRPLPFAREAVTGDARMRAALARTLDDLETPLDDLHRDQTLLEIAEALAALDPAGGCDPVEAIAVRAVAIAREYIDENIGTAIRSTDLEAISGLSRFALARHFRACLGTSPHRYSVMRRLDRARHLIQAGTSLAEAAAACGFADQSHMTRQFKRAYGVPPGHWQSLARPHPPAP
jgi:AraC-like DNA-binding protein